MTELVIMVLVVAFMWWQWPVKWAILFILVAAVPYLYLRFELICDLLDEKPVLKGGFWVVWALVPCFRILLFVCLLLNRVII